MFYMLKHHSHPSHHLSLVSFLGYTLSWARYKQIIKLESHPNFSFFSDVLQIFITSFPHVLFSHLTSRRGGNSTFLLLIGGNILSAIILLSPLDSRIFPKVLSPSSYPEEHMGSGRPMCCSLKTSQKS